MKFLETHTRSVTKVVSWRVLLTASHTINGFIATGSLAIGLQIAGWSLVINSVLYWLHERAWNWMQWNRRLQDGKLFKEGHPRTTTKMITWRVLVTFSNFFIPFIITGSWGAAALFAGLATVVNMALFYGHERIWNLVNWGKRVKIEPVASTM